MASTVHVWGWAETFDTVIKLMLQFNNNNSKNSYSFGFVVFFKGDENIM